MTYRVILLIVLNLCSAGLIAQNCLGMQNQDILNIAKQFKPDQLKNVIVEKNRIIARPEFKFVQLRNTETFILVPDEFQDRVIDFSLLLPENSQLRYVLDLNQLTARLECQNRNQKLNCQQERIGKNSVGCRNCLDAEWLTASPLSKNAILIPPYKKR